MSRSSRRERAHPLLGRSSTPANRHHRPSPHFAPPTWRRSGNGRPAHRASAGRGRTPAAGSTRPGLHALGQYDGNEAFTDAIVRLTELARENSVKQASAKRLIRKGQAGDDASSLDAESRPRQAALVFQVRATKQTPSLPQSGPRAATERTAMPRTAARRLNAADVIQALRGGRVLHRNFDRPRTRWWLSDGGGRRRRSGSPRSRIPTSLQPAMASSHTDPPRRSIAPLPPPNPGRR